MRHIIFIALISVSLGLVSCSTEENGANPPVTDIYAAGWERDAAGKYMVKVWKNGEELYSLAVIDVLYSSSINGIFVSGNDVYVVGEIYEKNKNGDNKYLGKVWKNNTELYSFDNGLGSSYAKGIHVSGGDVYVAGYEAVTSALNSIIVGWVRKNGEILYNLAGNISNPLVSAMYVSGNDIYVSGSAVNLGGVRRATVWKNGSQLFTFGPTTQSSPSETFDIAVSGNVVYVSGRLGSSPFPEYCIYKYEGSSATMALSYNAHAIDVFNNRFYFVVGRSVLDYVQITWDSYGSNASIYDLSVKTQGRYVCGNESKVAKVWRNGEELYALTDGTYDARATAIFIVER